MPPEGFASIRIDGLDLSLLRRIARKDYGMGAGALLGIIAHNWIRKRWLLEMPEGTEKPQDERSAPGPSL